MTPGLNKGEAPHKDTILVCGAIKVKRDSLHALKKMVLSHTSLCASGGATGVPEKHLTAAPKPPCQYLLR
jgi:hypothetical protein